MKPVINITNGIARRKEWQMAEPVNFRLNPGQHVAITGPNGGGKSMLVDIIVGRHPLVYPGVEYNFGNNRLVSENLQLITFRDTYGGDNDRTFFLQQRWNQMEIDEQTPTVGQMLETAFLNAGNQTAERRSHQHRLYDTLGMWPLLDKKIILLSSGELRKFKLASALFGNPKVLIIDNPFIGLDRETRTGLTTLLGQIVKEQGLQLILVMPDSETLPNYITHVVRVENRRIVPAVIRFNNVTIRYGERVILKNLSWTVNRHECWALSGRNGSGKSTLLSLVCADNPQAYACDIELFGRRRGTGESIWDIKRLIGYVSPEMHRSYRSAQPALKIVASGLKDSIGLYANPTEEEKGQCMKWMNTFHIAHLAERHFTDMSSGEQRLVLLARAFVKEPPLLILDEPMHGLDASNRKLTKDVIENYFQQPDKTIIIVTHFDDELPQCVTNRLNLSLSTEMTL